MQLHFCIIIAWLASLEVLKFLSRVDVPFVLTPIVPMLHFVTLYIFVILVIHKDTILKHKFTFPCWLMMFNIVCVCVCICTPPSVKCLSLSPSHTLNKLFVLL